MSSSSHASTPPSSEYTPAPFVATFQPRYPPVHATSRRRKRSPEDVDGPSRRFSRRATIANQTQIDAAKEQCFDSPNNVISCWPTSDTSLDQNEATQFVWNSRLPTFTQFNLVDIALVRADTGATVKTYTNQTNPTNESGFLSVIADDDFWQSNSWDGQDTPFPFYFIVVPSGTAFSAGLPQSTFTAIQTTFANSVLASSSSAAAAASSSSAAASRSSASAASSGSGSAQSGNTNGNGNVQNASTSSGFPHWAIAVIVVLGFLALAALVALIFLLCARARRRRMDASRRGSMGSQSPMMANVAPTGGPTSPQLEHPGLSAGSAAASGAGAGVLGGAALARAGSTTAETDGASAHSDNLFSGADAAVMAEAFRKALRKPEFADRPVEEGESPDAIEQHDEHPELLREHLAEEGRDIRSVGSSRGVRVETLSGEDGETAGASTPRHSLG